MISLIRAAYQEEPRVAEYTGLSSDDKYDKQVIPNPQNGDIFRELDTGTEYKYDETSQLWIAQPASGGGGGGGPTYTPGNGINISGTVISAKPGSGISVDSNGISVNTDVIATKDSVNNLQTKIDNIVDGTTPVTIPTASNNTLGGVKIGEGITVQPDGTISVESVVSVPEPQPEDANSFVVVNNAGEYELSDIVLINGGNAQE